MLCDDRIIFIVVNISVAIGDGDMRNRTDNFTCPFRK